MRTLPAVVLTAALAAAACAPRTAPAPVVTAPRFPDFIRPTVPADLAATEQAVEHHERAWRFLQAGDLRVAERESSLALKALPEFYPAETLTGYVELARREPEAALGHFDRALERRPDYASALAGRGEALDALERDAEAVRAFELAIESDARLVDLRRRVDVLRFRALERQIADARQAARAGRAEAAIAAYNAAIESSPESPFLYRELAAVERQRGDVDRALEHYRKAVELDTSDAASLRAIGVILEERGETEAALSTYDAALALEPDPATEERRGALRARLELARMPAEYRAIDTAPQVTRADLAALIGVRLAPVLQARQTIDAAVVTDVRANWAEPWILAVTRAGVMEPFANHTFQPRALVRRVDLAQVVSRLLPRVASAPEVRGWQTARMKVADVSAGHLAYPAVSTAVASNVMRLDTAGRFDPSLPVAGAEAVEAIERLRTMAKLPAPFVTTQR